MCKPIIALVAALLCAGLHPAHAVDLTVHGQPPLGAFGMETVEQVEACSKLGMTLVFTYEGDRHQLDVNGNE